MGKNYFSDEQVQQLQLNPYVKKVSNKAITYTDEFKVVFTEKYLKGNPPSIVLREMGFDPHILGKKRIDRIVGNVSKYQARNGDVSDMRKGCSGRPSTKELSDKERIARLEHQVEYLKQENEFLKKIEFLDWKADCAAKLKQAPKKNSSSSGK